MRALHPSPAAISPRSRVRAIALTCVFLAGAAHADVAVIVNSANAVKLDDAALARIYLGQVRSFPDDTAAQPVDQKDGSAIREEFTAKLVKHSPAHIKSYWAQQKFTGNVRSQKQLDGDEAVIKFIMETPNGIGYIDAAHVPAGVKVVLKY